MNLIPIISSIIYTIGISISVVGVKILNYYFNFNDYWWIIFFINIFAPLNIIIYLAKYKFKFDFSIKSLIPIFISAFIMNLENLALYWCLNSMPLGIYIIARTSSSIYNLFFTKFYLKKPIPKIYYLGIVFIVISYIFLIYDSITTTTNVNLFSLIIVLITGLTSSIYNNIIEKQISMQENKSFYYVLYQVIFTMTGFLFLIPLSSIFIKTIDIIPGLLLTLVGISSQLYFFFKFIVLDTPNVSGNQIVSGLDIFRRVFMNVLSYFVFNEFYDIFIILANICLLISSILFISTLINCKKEDNFELMEPE